MNKRGSYPGIFYFKAFVLAFLLAGGCRGALAQSSWTNFYYAGGEAQGVAIGVDPQGNVIASGYTDQIIVIKYSNTGIPLWTNFMPGFQNGFPTFPNSLTIDSNSDVFVCGILSTGANASEWIVLKYSSTGELIWTNTYQGTTNGIQGAAGMALDGADNLYVTGSSLVATGVTLFATIKYNPNGQAVWTNFYGGSQPGDDEGGGIALDAAGNIFVTGKSSGSNGFQGIATVAYSSSGQSIWTNRLESLASGIANFYEHPIALDTAGNVFVTGCPIDAYGVNDLATIKYSNNGTPLWTNYYSSASPGASPGDIIVDTNNRVTVTGSIIATNGLPTRITIQYSEAGTPLWTNLFSGIGKIIGTFGGPMAEDPDGNIYVTGEAPDGTTNGTALASCGTVMYSGSGTPLWTNYFVSSSGFAAAPGIALDKNSDVFVTGSASENGESSPGWLTIKYPSSLQGTPVQIVTADRYFGFMNGKFGFNYTAPAGLSVIIQSSSNLLDWTEVVTNPPAASPVYFSDPNSTSNSAEFYRAVTAP